MIEYNIVRRNEKMYNDNWFFGNEVDMYNPLNDASLSVHTKMKYLGQD